MIKKAIPYLLVLFVIFGVYRLLSIKPQNPVDSDLLLFWGNGCSHCETVKDYIKTQKLDSKIKITQKEVYYNQSNQKELESFANQCPEIDKSAGIGVPFAWIPDEKKCLIGDQPIIDWLNQKTGPSQ